MATAKRDRQRANRDAKRALERKARRRTAILTRARRILILALIMAALFVFLTLLLNSGSNDALGLTSVA